MLGIEERHLQAAPGNNHVEYRHFLHLAVNREMEAIFQQVLKHGHQVAIGNTLWRFAREVIPV